ncbi:MAG: AraC family transcriptional regulator [Synechococcales cyanobacterium CRU_2_2]|nr:AraC family transcriptional regulator [Synechococcales cyanobacterium CRU_2_2]
MDHHYSVSAKLIQGILTAAGLLGLPSAELLDAIHVSPAFLDSPDQRVALDKLLLLWQAIARRTQDPGIGLRMAEVTQFETFNVTGYAMSHSPTLGKALDRLVRYSRLFYGGIEFQLSSTDAEVSLIYRPVSVDIELSPIGVSWTLANLVLWGNRSLGQPWTLTRVEFQYPPPGDMTANRPRAMSDDLAADLPIYERIFGKRPTFAVACNRLVFAADWLEAPLTQADAGLCDLLDRYAEKLLQQVPVSGSIVDQLRHLLTTELRAREPKLEAIAHQLNYSPRTLQRKLQQEGTSFQQILDEIRRQLAVQYLQNPRLTSSEIAFLLGFSENTAFSRAFRRWEGMTPGEYRLLFTPRKSDAGIRNTSNSIQNYVRES